MSQLSSLFVVAGGVVEVPARAAVANTTAKSVAAVRMTFLRNGLGNRLRIETMNQISDRLRGLVQSDIRRMSRECERVGGINLGQGICDLPTIPELVEGACDAIVAHKATYSKFEGIDLLRERIARKMAHYNGVVCDPATEVVVTVGSSGGFAGAALATLNAGDEVILFEPYYGYHLNMLTVLG